MWDPTRAHRTCMENTFSPRTQPSGMKIADRADACAAHSSCPDSMAMQDSHPSQVGAFALALTEGQRSPPQPSARDTISSHITLFGVVLSSPLFY